MSTLHCIFRLLGLGTHLGATSLQAQGAERTTTVQPRTGTLGAGATFVVPKHAWWDFAVYRGISSCTADWNHVRRFNNGF